MRSILIHGQPEQLRLSTITVKVLSCQSLQEVFRAEWLDLLTFTADLYSMYLRQPSPALPHLCV